MRQLWSLPQQQQQQQQQQQKTKIYPHAYILHIDDDSIFQPVNIKC